MSTEDKAKADRATVVSEAGEAAEGVLKSLSPADRSWIAGFIVVVAIIVLSDMWVNLQTLKATTARAQETQTYFELVEANRSGSLERLTQQFADQSRRYQETIKHLTDAVVRDSERAGRAAVSAIDAAGDVPR